MYSRGLATLDLCFRDLSLVSMSQRLKLNGRHHFCEVPLARQPVDTIPVEKQRSTFPQRLVNSSGTSRLAMRLRTIQWLGQRRSRLLLSRSWSITWTRNAGKKTRNLSAEKYNMFLKDQFFLWHHRSSCCIFNSTDFEFTAFWSIQAIEFHLIAHWLALFSCKLIRIRDSEFSQFSDAVLWGFVVSELNYVFSGL